MIVLLVPENSIKFSTNFQGKSTCKIDYNRVIAKITILSFITMAFLDYTKASW